MAIWKIKQCMRQNTKCNANECAKNNENSAHTKMLSITVLYIYIDWVSVSVNDVKRNSNIKMACN